MTITMLSEPEAWRLIAQRVDRLPSHEGFLCDQVGYLSGRFTCGPGDAPFDYGEEHRIAAETATRMLRRINVYLRDVGNAWVGYPMAEYLENTAPALKKYRKARVLAALWLALEAEDDSR